MKAKIYIGIISALMLAGIPLKAQIADNRDFRNDDGGLVINNYYEDYDYYYASRINRFHRSFSAFDYYSPVFTDAYWYNYMPFSWGTSIYGRSGFGFGYSVNYPVYYSGWDFDPWYNYNYGGYDPYYGSTGYYGYDPFYYSWYSPVVINLNFGNRWRNNYWGWSGFGYRDHYRPAFSSYNNYHNYQSDRYSSRDYYNNRASAGNNRTNGGYESRRIGQDPSDRTREINRTNDRSDVTDRVNRPSDPRNNNINNRNNGTYGNNSNNRNNGNNSNNGNNRNFNNGNNRNSRVDGNNGNFDQNTNNRGNSGNNNNSRTNGNNGNFNNRNNGNNGNNGSNGNKGAGTVTVPAGRRSVESEPSRNNYNTSPSRIQRSPATSPSRTQVNTRPSSSGRSGSMSSVSRPSTRVSAPARSSSRTSTSVSRSSRSSSGSQKSSASRSTSKSSSEKKGRR